MRELEKQITTNDNVDYRFKFLYAVGIVLVVAGHCWGGGVNLFYDWFPPYSFHLGMFAFCSGYFYKSIAENNVKLYILKKVKKLIIPLYIWNLVYAIIVSLLGLCGFTIGIGITAQKLLVDPIISGHQFVYNLGGWFIVPLFMVESFTVLLRTLIQKIITSEHRVSKEVFFFTVHCLLGMLGVHIASIGYHTGYWLVLTRFLFFLPFYGMGIFYKSILEKYDQLSNITYFAILFFVQWIIVLVMGKIPTYTPSWCYDFVDGPLMPYIEGYLGTFFWLRVARIVEPIIGRSKIINLVANNTYTITINHITGFMLVKSFFALLYKCVGLCKDFDWYQYKNVYSYLYFPLGDTHTAVLYLVVGIAFPIMLQLLINKIAQKTILKYKIVKK